jgi:nucleoside-diphosphate-sugar epimerase
MSPFRFIQAIAEDRPVRLSGDGSQSRGFAYVDDIARGTVLALKKVGYKVINLGGNKAYSMNQMIRLIEKHLRKKAKIERHAFSKVDMKATRADISEARETLRWSPEVPFEQGLRRTVDWHLANGAWLSKIKT